MSLFEKEKKKQRDKYKEKLRVKLFELEKCEKKFDVEIYNTLNKLNEESPIPNPQSQNNLLIIKNIILFIINLLQIILIIY